MEKCHRQEASLQCEGHNVAVTDTKHFIGLGFFLPAAGRQSPYTHLIVITPFPGSFRKAEQGILHFIVKFPCFRTKPIH